MRKLILLLVLALLGACGGGGGGGADAPKPAAGSTSWTLEFAHGVPQQPLAWGEGFYIDLPYPSAEAGSVHYVTRSSGDLSQFSGIVMTYRVEMAPGVRIVPRLFPDSPSILTLYFQREGDSLTAIHEAWRWYASFASHSPVVAGEFTVQAPFSANWTAVQTSSRENNPQAFEEARRNAARVGFVLGGGDGLGHGVYATGPARIVVTSFALQ
jgi:hypothetical protein